MINLTKMNGIRMLHSKLFYVTMILCFGIFLLFTSLETDPETQELDRIIMEEEGIDADEARFGATVGGTLAQDTPLEDVYAEMVGSGVLLIFAGVFASVYSDEERKSGFVKNLTVGRNGKKYIFASKAPVLLLFCFLQLMVCLAAVWLGINSAGEHRVTSVGNLVVYILTETLLHTAFGLVLMVCYEVFRKIVVNILLAVFAALNLCGFVLSLLETEISVFCMLTEALGGRLEMTQYLLVTRARNMQVNENVFPFVPSLVASLIGLAVYLTLGMVIYSRRDTV